MRGVEACPGAVCAVLHLVAVRCGEVPVAGSADKARDTEAGASTMVRMGGAEGHGDRCSAVGMRALETEMSVVKRCWAAVVATRSMADE